MHPGTWIPERCEVAEHGISQPGCVTTSPSCSWVCREEVGDGGGHSIGSARPWGSTCPPSLWLLVSLALPAPLHPPALLAGCLSPGLLFIRCERIQKTSLSASVETQFPDSHTWSQVRRSVDGFGGCRSVPKRGAKSLLTLVCLGTSRAGKSLGEVS